MLVFKAVIVVVFKLKLSGCGSCSELFEPPVLASHFSEAAEAEMPLIAGNSLQME